MTVLWFSYSDGCRYCVALQVLCCSVGTGLLGESCTIVWIFCYGTGIVI